MKVERIAAQDGSQLVGSFFAEWASHSNAAGTNNAITASEDLRTCAIGQCH